MHGTCTIYIIMISLQFYLYMFLALFSVGCADIKTFNVINFGAIGNGRTDDLPVVFHNRNKN